MDSKSYFNLREWIIIIFTALFASLINGFLPIKAIIGFLNISGPAAGMALFGGVIFVFWISLAYRIIGKRYSGIITAVCTASFCLFIQPWYGIIEPLWFSIYAIVGLLCLGIVIEIMTFESLLPKKPPPMVICRLLNLLGGALGNLVCLIITWLAIGFHTGSWVQPGVAPFLIFFAFISGAVGIWLSLCISDAIKARLQ